MRKTVYATSIIFLAMIICRTGCGTKEKTLEVEIKAFNPDGNYLRTVSKKGQGPGEFDIPAYFRIVNDHIYLLDSRQRKFSLLTLKGEYLKGFKIEGFPSAFDVAPDGNVYYCQMLNPEVELGEIMQKIKNYPAIIAGRI